MMVFGAKKWHTLGMVFHENSNASIITEETSSRFRRRGFSRFS
jgi:hypothetical protein